MELLDRIVFGGEGCCWLRAVGGTSLPGLGKAAAGSIREPGDGHARTRMGAAS